MVAAPPPSEPPAQSPAVPARSELLASDADRERIADVLRDALVEGRLKLVEFESRLEDAHHARTYGELEHLVRDLPLPVTETALAPTNDRVGGRPTSRLGIAILGGFNRRGVWTIARRFTAVAVMGGGQVDLREAKFEEPVTIIRCFAVMGGISVLMPPEVDLEVRGMGILGGFDQRASGVGEPGAPRVVVTGFSFWGGVDVERKVTKAERRRLKAERKARRQLERQRDDDS
ncbi:DUF1707 domain-containing protein [Kribbella sp. NBC_01505]|uniref:DUF1707 SHOCT-like domain-containing protein n=1 Tax=Kribbella sp. NBC_01505 TaxID=2903580 RepID=UPI003864CCAD